MLSQSPGSGHTAAKIIPLGSPTRAELWSRHQLALAVLNHGRCDRAELLAILNGAAIDDLTHPHQVV